MNIAWVKAHQDDAKPICELGIDAKLNCTANRDAKIFRLNVPDHFSPVGAPPVLPLNRAYIALNGTMVTNNFKTILQDNYEAIDIRKYVKRKTGLNDASIDKIDWSALSQNLQRQHLFNQIRLVKFMHNWCKDANSVANCTLAITKFCATLLKSKTAPIIRDVLTYNLSQWILLATGNALSIHRNNLRHNLSLALEEQADIGWENFVKGRVSEWWVKLQQIFYNDVYSSSNYKKELWTA
eukprot:2207319-Ditylum_brightwellii.AAC.1